MANIEGKMCEEHVNADFWKGHFWVEYGFGENPDIDHYCNPSPYSYSVSSSDGRETKASGNEKVFASGMSRDDSTGKPRFDLMVPEGMPYEELMLTRLAGLYARGGAIRGDRNWENANSQEDLNRFKESAFRHFMQWIAGETDEDHAAGAVWNLFASEYVAWKMAHGQE